MVNRDVIGKKLAEGFEAADRDPSIKVGRGHDPDSL
jgi:hypothetical protein